MSEGRLHVHLYELKQQLMDKHPGHGDLSNYLREIIRAYVEERFMILSDEVLEVIDEADFQTAVDLLLPGLQKLREERMQAGEKKTKARKKRKADAGRGKGKASEKKKATESMYKQLMEGFK